LDGLHPQRTLFFGTIPLQLRNSYIYKAHLMLIHSHRYSAPAAAQAGVFFGIMQRDAGRPIIEDL
jgi:hypothetical protein